MLHGTMARYSQGRELSSDSMRWWLAILLLVCGARAQAQRSFDVAFCDVENLYDTIPSSLYDDSDYTPRGRLRWDTARYSQKIKDVARLLDSLSLPVVALWGVENEQVVRDIAIQTKGDYAYIHRTHDYSDGLDFALFYYGDRFFPERVTPWRGALCVEGRADGRDVAIVVNHRSTSLGVLISERGLNENGRIVIVLGIPSQNNISSFGLQDHALEAERAGRGTSYRESGWEMLSRIASSWGGEVRCDVYAARWLLDERGGVRPTYKGGRYYGGVSSSLPIFAQFFHY